MYRRGPTVTPSVMLPAVAVETLATFCTSPVLHSGATSRPFTLWMTSVFRRFRSAPTFGVGDVTFLWIGGHQDRVTHDVTVIFVLQCVSRVVGTSKLLQATRLEVCRFLQPGRVVRLESLFFAESFTPIQGRARTSAAPMPKGLAALQGAVNVSLLCTSILRHWKEPFLFNIGQVPMFPRCLLPCAWEEPRRHLAHYLPVDHPKAILFVDFDPGQRSPE